MTDERVARLPKWAQDEMRVLRMQLGEAKATIEQLQFGADNPRTNLHFPADRRGFDGWAPGFQYRARVYIGPKDRDWIEVRHSEEARHPALHVYGERTLLVRPHVTNVLSIFLEDR
jgi:hypothetical protein